MHRVYLLLFIVFFPVGVSATVKITTILPNPSGPDEYGEYIELRNIGCDDVDMNAYQISDLSEKQYIFLQSEFLGGHQTLRVPYSRSKIMLNNSGDESLFLKNQSGVLIDEIHYSGTQKDDTVIDVIYSDIECPLPTTSESGSQLDSSSDNIPDIESHTGGIMNNSGESIPIEDITTPTQTGNIDIEDKISETSHDATESYFETGTLVPVSLYYNDIDGNSHIDTLEIYYPYFLTGNVHTGALELYSDTGGLFSYRVQSLTGYIYDGYCSGNILVLLLQEGDMNTIPLRVNNTTSSHLRLKSISDMGFRSIGGQTPEPLYLTKSFDEYRNVFAKTLPTQPLIGEGDTVFQEINTGSLFPEIVPTFQQYSNVSFSGDMITCLTSPCRMNLTFAPIFTGAFLERNFSCQITFSGNTYSSCNPPQWTSTSSGDIRVSLVEKSHGIIQERIFSLIIRQETSNGDIQMNGEKPINRPPIAIIEMDGKWKKYFSSPEHNHILCYAFTCSINLTGEHSFDPDNDHLRYLWLYDYQGQSEKKDPGTKTFSLGHHTIWLRVIDTFGNVGEEIILLDVIHPDLIPKEEEHMEVQDKIKKTKKLVSKTHVKPKKIRPVTFYDPPDVIIQNKHPENIRIAGTHYTCFTKSKACSMNFTLSGTQKGYIYEWIFPSSSERYISKNPRSFAFGIGNSLVHLVIKDGAGNIMANTNIEVTVKKTVKTNKKSKKVIKKQATLPTQLEKGNISQELSHIPPKKAPDGGKGALIVLLLSLGFFSFLRRRFFSA